MRSSSPAPRRSESEFTSDELLTDEELSSMYFRRIGNTMTNISRYQALIGIGRSGQTISMLASKTDQELSIMIAQYQKDLPSSGNRRELLTILSKYVKKDDTYFNKLQNTINYIELSSSKNPTTVFNYIIPSTPQYVGEYSADVDDVVTSDNIIQYYRSIWNKIRTRTDNDYASQFDAYHPTLSEYSDKSNYIHWMLLLLDGDFETKIMIIAMDLGLNIKLPLLDVLSFLWYLTYENNLKILENIDDKLSRYTTEYIDTYMKDINIQNKDEFRKIFHNTGEAVYSFITGNKIMMIDIIPPSLEKRNRYMEYLMSKPIFGVFITAFVVYFSLNRSTDEVIESGSYQYPYDYLCCVFEKKGGFLDYISKNPWIRFSFGVTGIDDLVQKMLSIGMVPSVEFSIIDYYISSIHQYNKVFTRTELDRPIILNSPKRDDLSLFTDKELISYFEPDDLNYLNRGDLLYRCIMTPSQTRWAFRKNRPNNLDFTTPSLETVLENFEDIYETYTIVSYGNRLNYRCFDLRTILEDGLSERVIGEAGEYKKSFFNPDYLTPSTRGDVYPVDTISELAEFTPEQTLQLYKLLKAIPNKNKTHEKVINSLFEFIKIYIEGSETLRRLISDYHSLDKTRKNIFGWFCRWFMVLTLYSRMWKGPGFPYPTKYRYIEHGDDILCTAFDRDANIIKHGVKFQQLMEFVKEQYTPGYSDLESVSNVFGYLASPGESLDDKTQNRKFLKLMNEMVNVSFDLQTKKYSPMTGKYSNMMEVFDMAFTQEVNVPGARAGLCHGYFGDVGTRFCVFLMWKFLGIDNFDQISIDIKNFIINEYKLDKPKNDDDDVNLLRIKYQKLIDASPAKRQELETEFTRELSMLKQFKDKELLLVERTLPYKFTENTWSNFHTDYIVVEQNNAEINNDVDTFSENQAEMYYGKSSKWWLSKPSI